MDKQENYSAQPFMLFLGHATKQNNAIDTVLWSGQSMRLSLMSILPDHDTTMEPLSDGNRLICVEQGRGLIKVGEAAGNYDYQRYLIPGNAILIPMGSWHSLINVGNAPLKVYCISAQPRYSEGNGSNNQ